MKPSKNKQQNADLQDFIIQKLLKQYKNTIADKKSESVMLSKILGDNVIILDNSNTK